jgi:hypothetical protein
MSSPPIKEGGSWGQGKWATVGSFEDNSHYARTPGMSLKLLSFDGKIVSMSYAVRRAESDRGYLYGSNQQ